MNTRSDVPAFCLRLISGGRPVVVLLGLVLMGLTAGCQPKVNPLFPVPLPLHGAAAESVLVVGEGSSADEARQRAMKRLVREILLPGGPEEVLPFIESMIRGYNIVSTERDLFGRYYVTIELTMVQLAINYQELYGLLELNMERLDEERLRAERAERQLRVLQGNGDAGQN